MSAITRIHARQVFDSRGNPTVEAEVFTRNGCGRASAPSGKSTGFHEAFELRDGGRAYGGKGVTKAVKNINALIARRLRGHDVQDQQGLDEDILDLDGTSNKRRLGANATTAVSLAAARCAADEREIPLYRHIQGLRNSPKLVLPTPAFNIINGGSHAGNQLDIQEYMILPVGAKSFAEAMRIGAEIYADLRDLLAEKFGESALNVGDEGGFAPQLSCAQEPFELIRTVIERCGYKRKVRVAIDAAASNFYHQGRYHFEGEALSAAKMLKLYEGWIAEYPLLSIEDPFHEEDFHHFAALTASKSAKKVQIVGDDLLVTNPLRIQQAIAQQSCNCLLLKVNQIGTLTEALKAAQLAQSNDWRVMVSHRSGETEDSFIADLAVGMGNGQIKAGAPCRSERLAKYNRLLRIEEELGSKARYAGGLR